MEPIIKYMTSNIVDVDVNTPISQAISIMRDKMIGSLIVKDNGKVAGIFTERDLLTRAAQYGGEFIRSTVVGDVMTRDLKTVQHTENFVKVLDVMTENHIRHMPVEKDGEIVGIVSFRDLLNNYREHLELELEQREDVLRENFKLIKESEKRFRTIFENTLVAITFADEHEKITTWNPYTEKLFGMSSAELRNKPVRELYPEEEWAHIRSLNIRHTGQKSYLETKVIHKDGSIIDVDISISVFKDGDGRVKGSIAVIKDNTDRKRIEEQLRSYREKLEEIVEERTLELQAVNRRLAEDIASRERMASQLKEYQEHLEDLVKEQTKQFEATNVQLQKELVDRKKAETELAKKMENLSVLYSVSKALNFATDLNKMLLFIIDKARDVVGAQKASLMLLDNKTDELVVHVVRGVPPDVEDEINSGRKECARIKLNEGVAGKVAATKRHMLVNKVVGDQRFKRPGESYVDSILCTPLIANDEVIGVINLTNKTHGGSFGEDDVELLSTLASQAAITIYNARLYHLAITDGLTQLRVHRYFQQRLDEEIIRSEKFKHPVSLIMADIDFFKKFNDAYGHQEGDIVLMEIAKVIRLNVRDVDITARYGGEEFSIILPEADIHEAMNIAENLRNKIQNHEYPSKLGKLKVTISFGVATYPDHANNKKTLVGAADRALYRAKESGKNRVESAGNNPDEG